MPKLRLMKIKKYYSKKRLLTTLLLSLILSVYTQDWWGKSKKIEDVKISLR